MNRLLWIVCLTVGALKAHAEEPKTADLTAEGYRWVFLTTGEPTSGVSPDDLKKYQEAHLANFWRLAKDGQLLLAGPAVDPDKSLRGILLLKVADRSVIPSLFTTDPLVERGYLKVEAADVDWMLGRPKVSFTETGMGEFRMVVLEDTAKGPPLTVEARGPFQAYCEQLRENQRLKLAMTFSDAHSGRRGIMIVPKMEDSELDKLVKEIPLLKLEKWQSKSMPLYTAKSSLDPSP